MAVNLIPDSKGDDQPVTTAIVSVLVEILEPKNIVSRLQRVDRVVVRDAELVDAVTAAIGTCGTGVVSALAAQIEP